MKPIHPIASSLLVTLALLSIRVDSLAQQQVSDAEKRVFMTDHLKSVAGPATLSYQFTKSGSFEQGFQDKVTLSVKAPATGSGKDCHIDFLAGERQFKGMPDVIENATGNPIILAFLERDLSEMKRITKGQPNYYRKRIRMNLAEKAEIRPVTIKHEGKELPGFDVLLNPFDDDPARLRYEKYSNKSYIITLSDQIPGGVYKMYSIMRERAPEASPGKPMIEETLTFTGIKK
ncbi:MAG: hypothetical protein ABIP64_15360 [Burkholderiales bacterium]